MGFMGPKRRVSRPRRAISSMGRQASKYGVRSSANVGGHVLRVQQFVDETLVLLAVERAVEVIVGAVGGFAVARGPEGDAGVDGLGIDDGADAVVEEQAAGAGQARDLPGQRFAGERAGGDDDDGVFAEARSLPRGAVR